MARGRSKLAENVVVWAAWIVAVVLAHVEFKLEFDELVLLVWTLALPIMALINLIAPLIRESAELRIYLILFVICPGVLLYFYGNLVTFDEAVLLAVCVAPIASLLRFLRASLRQKGGGFNRDFWRERLPELFLLVSVGVLPVGQ